VGADSAYARVDQVDVDMVELLRAVGDELDVTCGVSRGPLRALTVGPREIVVIVGALTPGEPNTLVRFERVALARLAAFGRSVRGQAVLRRPILHISPAGYADLLRAVGLLAGRCGWTDLRLLPFERGLVLYHDGGREEVLGERRVRALVNDAYARRDDAALVAEYLGLTRHVGPPSLEARHVEPRPYTYAGALAALGGQLARDGRRHALIADVADGFALMSLARDGGQHVEVIMAAGVEEDMRRRGKRRAVDPAVEEWRAVGAYLDRVHAREILVQQRPATPQTPRGLFALAFTALSGERGAIASFERRLIPSFAPGMTDQDIDEA